MTRKIFGKVTWVGVARTLALGVAMAAALAMCLVTLQPAHAAFPGQNGRIAFQSDRDGPVEIYATSPGGTPKRITLSNGSSDPAYSPDGSKIAFVSGGGLGYDIFVMNSDGTGRKQLTNTGSADLQPAWSPDGRKIAFVSNTFSLNGQTDYEIWVMNADGTNPTPITNNSYSETQPAWSPDGSKIAFESSRRDLGDTDQNIYVMNADGSGPASNLTPYTPGPQPGDPPYQGHDDDPAWSPDGSKIAYVHTFAPNASGVPNIWVMDANGGNKINIQNNQTTSGVEPAWSPDGSKIAYVGATDTNRDIYTMNANGSGQATVETGGNPAYDISPDWQPVSIRVGDARVKEKNTSARFTVSLSGASDQAVTVDYATANGTAKAPADYTGETDTLTFSPGQTSKTVTVAVKGDRKNERNETFFVNLSDASTTVADAGGKGTIVDND